MKTNNFFFFSFLFFWTEEEKNSTIAPREWVTWLEEINNVREINLYSLPMVGKTMNKNGWIVNGEGVEKK